MVSLPKNVLESLCTSPSFSLYSLDYTISLFSEDTLKKFERLISNQQKFTLTHFLKASLQVIRQPQSQRLFLAYGLYKLFEDICKGVGNTYITFLQFTSYIVDKLPKFTEEVMIQEKILPFENTLPDSLKRSLVAPHVYGKNRADIRRLQTHVVHSDRLAHINRRIDTAWYSPFCKSFISVDSPSDIINVLDQQCKLVQTVKTQLEVAKREGVILSLAWAEEQLRIGAILANYSNSFWSQTDSFRFEVNVPLEKSLLKNPPAKIYYVGCEKQWITLDSRPTIYFLSPQDFTISERFQHSKMRCDRSDSIVLSEARYQRLLIVAFDRTVLLISMKKKQILSELGGFTTNIYTICFSDSYQTLFVGCFEPYFQAYELSEFCDLTEKGRFQSHRTVITSLATVEGLPIVISIYEDWTIKLWDIRDLSCYQTFNAPRNILFRQILPLGDKGICLVGSNLFTYHFQVGRLKDPQKAQHLAILKNRILLITNRSVTLYNTDTGRTHSVIKAVFQEDDILASNHIFQQGLVLLVSQHAYLKIIDCESGSAVGEVVSVGSSKPIYVKCQLAVRILCVCCQRGVKFFQYTPLNHELVLKRSIIDFDEPLKLAKCSYEHDTVAVSHGSYLAYFYSFERGKPRGSLLMGFQIQDFEFIKRQKLFAVLGVKQMVLMEYKVNTHSVMEFTVRARFEINSKGIEFSSLYHSKPDQIWILCATGDIFSVQNVYEGPALSEDIDPQYYNAYRVNTESHRDAYFRVKPEIPKASKKVDEIPIQLKMLARYRHHSKNCVMGITQLGSLLLSCGIDGNIKAFTQDAKIEGSITLDNPLPDFWRNLKDRSNELSELQFLIEILESLKQSEPRLTRYLDVSEFLLDQYRNYKSSSIDRKTKEEQIGSDIIENMMAAGPLNKILKEKEHPSTISSLREKKIVIQKARQDLRNLQNFQDIAKKSTKKSQANPDGYKDSNKEEEQNKQILMFFDEGFSENLKKKGIEEKPLTKDLKDLEYKLDLLMSYNSTSSNFQNLKKSFMAESLITSRLKESPKQQTPLKSGLKSAVMPISEVQMTKSVMQSQWQSERRQQPKPLAFYESEMITRRLSESRKKLKELTPGTVKNAKQLIQSLDSAVLNTKCRKKSLSLPKLPSRVI